MSELLFNSDRRDRNDACIQCMAKISLSGDFVEGNKAARDSELSPSLGLKDASEIAKIIDEYSGESMIIIGAPGVGKSTIAQHLDALDMDSMFDSMPTEIKQHLLHHEYYFDENQSKVRKRTIPFSQDVDYISDLSKTTRQLSLYAEEFFREKLSNGTVLIGTTPVPADKVILLKAGGEDLLRNAEMRSRTTVREVDFQRALYIDRLIEKITREMFAEKDIIVYNMQYE